MAKTLVSVRMSDTGRIILDTLQSELGITQAGVVEMALRDLAKKHGVKLTAPDSTVEKPVDKSTGAVE